MEGWEYGEMVGRDWKRGWMKGRKVRIKENEGGIEKWEETWDYWGGFEELNGDTG